MINDFTKTFEVKTPMREVFQKIKDVRSWWSGLFDEKFTGVSDQLNEEFEFRAGDGVHYSKQKLIEFLPHQKIVWLVTDSHLSFLEKPDEWNGTKIIFDLSEQKGKTSITFTHEGLNPSVECYDACAPAWSQYLTEKLYPLIS